MVHSRCLYVGDIFNQSLCGHYPIWGYCTHLAEIDGAQCHHTWRYFGDRFPAALSQLTSAIAVEKTLKPIENKDEGEPGVSIANRALPLINLLSAAAKENCNVMW